MKHLINNVSIPWLGYVMFFVGIGFVSGAIVHYPLDKQWFTIIGLVGAVLFVIGAIINEIYVLKKDIIKEGIVGFVFFSLLLSLGVGMVAGGIQHFADIAERAVYLVPLGILLSLVSFVFKNKVELNVKHFIVLLLKGLAIAIPTYLLLAYLAPRFTTSPKQNNAHHASSDSIKSQEAELDDDNNTSTLPNNTHHESGQKMGHQVMQVTSEKQFLLEMIPHHQDAVNSSIKILSSTQNSNIETLAQDILIAQTAEIEQMKQWLKDWYGTNYTSAMSSYTSMMSEATTNETSTQKDLRFLKDMSTHHAAAITMAQDLLKITKKPELINLAHNIVKTQNEEIKNFDVEIKKLSK